VAALVLGTQVRQEWSDGEAERTVLYALRGVSTGDTVDLSPDFSPVKRAVLLGVTVAGAVVASNAGNVITIPAGVSSDAAYLLVFGVHA